jgi:hypothetical protein
MIQNETIHVRYSSIDGHSERRRFKLLRNAKLFAHKWERERERRRRLPTTIHRLPSAGATIAAASTRARRSTVPSRAPGPTTE